MAEGMHLNMHWARRVPSAVAHSTLGRDFRLGGCAEHECHPDLPLASKLSWDDSGGRGATSAGGPVPALVLGWLTAEGEARYRPASRRLKRAQGGSMISEDPLCTATGTLGGEVAIGGKEETGR